MADTPRLSQVRIGRGVRQRDIAGALSVSRQRISSVESSPLSSLQVGTVASYARGMGGRLVVGIEFPHGVVPLWWGSPEHVTGQPPG